MSDSPTNRGPQFDGYPAPQQRNGNDTDSVDSPLSSLRYEDVLANAEVEDPRHAAFLRDALGRPAVNRVIPNQFDPKRRPTDPEQDKAA